MLSLIDVALQEASDPAQHNAVVETAAINPLAVPGELVIIMAASLGDSVSGRIAARLAVEHFVSAVLECEFLNDAATGERRELSTEGEASKGERSRAVCLLEAGFERANQQIYAFGHRLAAGGSLGTSLLAVAVSGGDLAAGRVGGGDVVLTRHAERVQLFGAQREVSQGQRVAIGGESSVLVGAHRQVPVEFLEVGLEAHDACELWCEPPLLQPSSVSRGTLTYNIDEVGAVHTPRSRYWWRLTLGPESVFLSSSKSHLGK